MILEIFFTTLWLSAMFWVNAYFVGYFAAKGWHRGKYE